MTSHTAPKADALPGCATPRTAVSLGNAAVDGNPGDAVRGSMRQNEAGTGNGSYELSPNPDPRFTTRAELEAWAAKEARKPKTATGMLKALDRIRRVTLAHVHLPDIDGGGA